LAATVNVTAPSSVPLAPDVIVIHGTLLPAVHRHPAWVDTFTVPGPPVAPMLRLVGAIVNEQFGAAATAACLIVDRWPPMMTLPVRSPPALGATVKLTVALPLPLTGGASVIQLTSAVADHAQSLAVVTLAVAGPPAALMFWVAGATSYRQGARCDTRT
jgi:hypothetical protein